MENKETILKLLYSNNRNDNLIALEIIIGRSVGEWKVNILELWDLLKDVDWDITRKYFYPWRTITFKYSEWSELWEE